MAKADKAYFDIKPGKNPFDPIDLGDLIFKYMLLL